MASRFVVANPGTHPELTHLTSALAAANEDVDLLTSSMWPAKSPLVTAAHRWSRGRLRENLIARRLPDTIERRSVRNFGWIPELLFQLGRRLYPNTSNPLLRFRNQAFTFRASRYIQSLDQEIVLIAQQTCALPLFEVSKLSKFPVTRVLNYPIAHHRWADEYMTVEAKNNPSWAPFLQGQGLDPVYSRFLDQEIEAADLVLVASDFVRRTFLESGIPESKMLVVPLGCSPPSESTVQNEDRHNRALRVLFAGQVNQRKGISYLLDALANFPGQVDFRVVGPSTDEMQRRLQEFPHVHVVGEATQEELSRHYEWADLVILPSLIEGFGLTALDAMAHERPVIVTTHTFARDIITHEIDGFVIPPCNSAELADLLSECITGTYDLAKMGQLAGVRARQFTWANYGDKVMRALTATDGARLPISGALTDD